MNYIHFLQGLVVWALVATILTLIIYLLSYALSRIFGTQIKGKPWQLFLMILAGCEIVFILQTVLRELGFQPETSRYYILIVSIGFVILARVYHYLTYKK
jgi:hypothetical protein